MTVPWKIQKYNIDTIMKCLYGVNITGEAVIIIDKVANITSYIYTGHFRKKSIVFIFKGTDHVATFMGLKCVVYYANYRSGN